jgi:hypothetical protein
MADLVELILSSEQMPVAQASRVVPGRPGYYSIWIDDPDALPGIYAEYLRGQHTQLIYVGIASQSLQKRLIQQDLYHNSPSTFFRGLGAVLGYRPPRGSLVGKKNQNNYKFSGPDTLAIVAWIESHLSVGVIEEAPTDSRREAGAITQLCPVLNTDHNPRALKELAQLRLECREIARSTA